MRTGCLISLLLMCALAHAASFDCTQARTPQEKAICASPKLSAADEQMAAAYKNALSATSPAMVADVRADQRAWLGRLSLECPPGRVRFDQSMTDCLLQNYDARTKALHQLVQQKGGITFVWRSMFLMNREEPANDETGTESSSEFELIPGYGTLAVSWPQTNASTHEWRAWNKAIVAAAQRVASQNGAGQDGQWHADWAGEDDGDLTVEIGVVNQQLTTAFIDRWGWRGAHPWESSIQFNWLLKEQREIKPDDVFRQDSNWDELLVQRCIKILVKDLGQNYENSYAGPDKLPSVLHEIILDSKNWQISRKGLSIVFQDYAIAPRVLHPGPVTIPWADLKPYLQPTFLIPR